MRRVWEGVCYIYPHSSSLMLCFRNLYLAVMIPPFHPLQCSKAVNLYFCKLVWPQLWQLRRISPQRLQREGENVQLYIFCVSLAVEESKKLYVLIHFSF